MINENDNREGVVIQGLDLIDIISIVDKKKRKYLALMLQDVEEVLKPTSPEFKIVRKIILDNVNSYTRSLVRSLLGDIEIERYSRE